MQNTDPQTSDGKRKEFSSAPVVIIEDDADDQEMLTEVFQKLNYANEIIFFADGNDALKYLNETVVAPFLILSDINLPRINGLDLRKQVHQNQKLNIKCIPYLFFTTASDKKFVVDAYSASAQGFFKKPTSYEKLENTIRIIMEYWTECISPNQYD